MPLKSINQTAASPPDSVKCHTLVLALSFRPGIVCDIDSWTIFFNPVTYWLNDIAKQKPGSMQFLQSFRPRQLESFVLFYSILLFVFVLFWCLFLFSWWSGRSWEKCLLTLVVIRSNVSLWKIKHLISRQIEVCNHSRIWSDVFTIFRRLRTTERSKNKNIWSGQGN